MKILIWLLVLANVGAYAYFHRESLMVSKLNMARPDLNAEQLKLLTVEDLNAMPKRGVSAPTVELPSLAQVQGLAPNPTVTNAETPLPQASTESSPVAEPKPAPPATTSRPPEVKIPEVKMEAKPETKSEAKEEAKLCYEWASFDLSNVAEAASRANKLDIKTSINQQNAGEAVRYWVYKPPLATAELAQKKAEELRALGIHDFFVVQDGKWRNAISFGVFKDEQLATNLMNNLKSKGVRELVKATRNKGDGHAVIRLLKVSPQQYQQLQKVLPDFPDTGLKEMHCQ